MYESLHRRAFLRNSGLSLGGLALSTLLANAAVVLAGGVTGFFLLHPSRSRTRLAG